MTSDENPADTVTEKAAKAYRDIWLNDTPGIPWENLGRSARATYIDAMRRFADDGWLADPAERDEPYDQLDNQRNLWAKQCHEAEARAERAEAEVARLEGQFSDMRGRYAEVAAEVAELRATVDRATKVLRNATYDMPTASLINLLRAALRDPNGGAS